MVTNTPSTRPTKAAIVAAWTVPVAVLPSAIWRIALAAGAFSDNASTLDLSPAERIYVPFLSAVSLGAALLTPGLVQRWGERVPNWVPRFGGRDLPVRLVVLPAILGGTLLTLISAYAVLNGQFHWIRRVKPLIGEDGPDMDISGAAEILGSWAYAPLLLWGPVVVALAIHYARRHRSG